MPRVTAVEPAVADGKAKALLGGVEQALGFAPNLMRGLANSPAALEASLGFSRTLGGGVLGAETREGIALALAAVNGCDYCASAHTAIANGAGVSQDEILANIGGSSADPTRAAAIAFARAVVDARGRVRDADLQTVREADHDDGAIAEIVAHVAINLFTNYFNQVADTEIDFPEIQVSNRPAA